MSKNLLLIDGHGLAFRGFYALPETLFAADGTPTNAILGFTTMLLNGLDKWWPDRGQRDVMNFLTSTRRAESLLLRDSRSRCPS